MESSKVAGTIAETGLVVAGVGEPGRCWAEDTNSVTRGTRSGCVDLVIVTSMPDHRVVHLECSQPVSGNQHCTFLCLTGTHKTYGAPALHMVWVPSPGTSPHIAKLCSPFRL